MPKILALDTSTDACSVALALDGEMFEDFRVIPRQHTKELLPMVQQLLQEHGLKVSGLDAIAFGRGPGSFAGIRIATGVTQGLAYAADLPVLPVSTLDALALAAYQREGAEFILAALDARMDEIYIAEYQIIDGQLQRVSEEQVCSPAKFRIKGAGKEYLAVGSGFRYLSDMSSEIRQRVQVSDQEAYPSAKVMLQLAGDDWEKGVAVSAEQALPVYLRDEVAWKKKDQQ